VNKTQLAFIKKVSKLVGMDWKALAARPKDPLTVIMLLASGMPKMTPQKTFELIDELAKKNPPNPNVEYKKWVDKLKEVE